MPEKPVIRLIDVEKVYRTEDEIIWIFNGLSLDIHPNDFLVITGSTGSGKTTLMNIITGLDRPSSGRVLVNGVDITKLSEDKLSKLRAKLMGISLQSQGLLPNLTVYENVELPLITKGIPPVKRAEMVERTLDIVGLLGKAYRRTEKLSFGERQCVSIARALVADPPILVLDEPTQHLDPVTTEFIISLLRGLHMKRKKTLIVTTRTKKLADVATKVLHLRKRSFRSPHPKIGLPP